MSISRFIVSARRKMGLSQKGLAEALGVSQGSVSKWEAGKESPRAETVEKIRELSGIPADQPKTEYNHSKNEFAAFLEVPFKGRFSDGLPYEPFDANDLKTLMIYLEEDFQGYQFEAWHVTGMYESLPRSFIGIFRIIDVNSYPHLQSRPARNSKILVRSADPDGTVSLSIEELYGDDRRGRWLWPLDRRARSRTLPVKMIDEEALNDTPATETTPYADLVAVLYEPSFHYQGSF